MFDVEFPLPKLDLLLIREAEGGMENWGLIIGSASFYTTLPEGRDIGKLRKIASMASHEIAHQWFGNITTMKCESSPI
jgi:aminopeptidase 2